MPLTRSPSRRHVLAEAGEYGMTWREYAEASGAHHGSASGALSKMHQRGQAARLQERRDNNAVYVHPDFVAGRPTVPRIVRGTAPLEGMPVAEVEAMMDTMAALHKLQQVAEAAEREARHMAEVNQLMANWSYTCDGLLLDRDSDREHYELRLTASEEKNDKLRNALTARVAEMTQAHKKELAKKVAAAAAEAREEGEATGWQEGYDEGIKRGQSNVVGVADANAFTEGRAAGRAEGEEMIRRRVGAVSVELYKTIVESTPIRSHFNGCYKIHPECAVKALQRSAGIPARPGIGLSRAG